MADCPQHTFQILTKRSQRLRQIAEQLPWPRNVWMGVSVENASYRFRIDHLRNVPAKVRFLSIEPLIGPVGELDLAGIHWVIVGGESGHRARSLDEAWVTDIRDQCVDAGTAFFFKQGSRQKYRDLPAEIDESPAPPRVWIGGVFRVDE